MAWKKVATIWMKRDRGRRARERYTENWNQKREWSQKNIHFGAVTSNFHSIYWVTRNNFYGYFVFKGRTKRTKHINDSKTPKINSEVKQTRDNDFFHLFFSLDPVLPLCPFAWTVFHIASVPQTIKKEKWKLSFSVTPTKSVEYLLAVSVGILPFCCFFFSYFFCLSHFISFYSQRWPY